MKLKRLVTSLSASFDGFVNSVENHEAVAEHAITDVRHAAARLRAQKDQLDSRITRQASQQQDLTARLERWQRRASECAIDDPEQALLCLRRRDAASEALARLTQQSEEQSHLSAELANNLVQVEARLTELQNRRTALSSREARATALAGGATPSPAINVDELFERWEVAVLQDEYRDGLAPLGQTTGDYQRGVDHDDLDKSLLAKEREAELKRELTALQNTTRSTQANRAGSEK